jgi:hypothetical protein
MRDDQVIKASQKEANVWSCPSLDDFERNFPVGWGYAEIYCD